MKQQKIAEWALRLALSAGFLSACADRFGWWPKAQSAWGNWNSFVAYTKTLLPWAPARLVSPLAIAATALEILFGILLLTPFKTPLVARASAALLLAFALCMLWSLGPKPPLDYSVFTAAGAAYALSVLSSGPGRKAR